MTTRGEKDKNLYANIFTDKVLRCLVVVILCHDYKVTINK